MEIKEIKAKIDEHNAQIAKIQEEARALFNENIKSLLRKSGVKSLNISVNNYAFNDGDPQYFSFYYHDMTVVFNNGDEFDGYGEKKDVYGEVRDEIVDFFEYFDNDDFYEEVFGPECNDERCRITIEAE